MAIRRTDNRHGVIQILPRIFACVTDEQPVCTYMRTVECRVNECIVIEFRLGVWVWSCRLSVSIYHHIPPYHHTPPYHKSTHQLPIHIYTCPHCTPCTPTHVSIHAIHHLYSDVCSDVSIQHDVFLHYIHIKPHLHTHRCRVVHYMLYLIWYVIVVYMIRKTVYNAQQRAYNTVHINPNRRRSLMT